jgi:peptidoglycan/xylan/chitin deacetylase (PgdA/CDA1 family)
MGIKGQITEWSPAHIVGIVLLLAAAGASFIHPLPVIAFLLSYIVLCVAACFFPQMNFLGPVISRGRTGENIVALTFDDGPSQATTVKILDLLDRYSVKAAFFVSGMNAVQCPDLISEIIRRGHSIGNHSYRHDPFVMLKGRRTLYREVGEANRVLLQAGVHALAFRPPVGIVNPKLFPILHELGLYCITFSLRAGDAGNYRVKHIAARILKKVQPDDIIMLHDKPPRQVEDHLVLLGEIEKVLTGIRDKGLRIVPLSELAGREIMDVRQPY